MIKVLVFLNIFGFSTLTFAEEVGGHYEVLGRVTTFEYVDTQRREANGGEQGVAAVFGLFGAIFAEVMTVEKRAYYTYEIKTEDSRVFEVASRTNYNINDCVKVIYPKLPGGIPESGIDSDTKLQASKECTDAVPLPE